MFLFVTSALRTWPQRPLMLGLPFGSRGAGFFIMGGSGARPRPCATAEAVTARIARTVRAIIEFKQAFTLNSPFSKRGLKPATTFGGPCIPEWGPVYSRTDFRSE